MAAARRAQRPGRPDVDLRSPPRLLAAGARGRRPPADLPRTRPGAGRLLHGDGLHPRRAPAGDGAPVLRLVGLPGHRLLRPDQPVRHAPGPDVPDRPPAPARHRRHPRLGAGPLPDRRARPGATSTAPTSTSTPTRGRAITPTGAASSSTTAATRCELPDLQRASSGWTATTPTGCASMPSPHAVPGLLAQGRASGSRTSYGGRENLEAMASSAA